MKERLLAFLKRGDTKGALAYKNKDIPDLLYKFYPLLDERFANYEQVNENRLALLGENEFWMSSYSNLNDPYEFKALLYEEAHLAPKDLHSDALYQFIKERQSHYGIGCFSTNFSRNMPMWAHYANNHKGYCVEYEVVDPRYIFKVFYEEKRQRTTFLFPSAIQEIQEVEQGKRRRISNNTEVIFLLLFLTNFMKHETWSYEDEYRILYNFHRNIGEGRTISNGKLGIWPKSIYLGLAISDDHRSALIEIAKKLQCAVYQMKLDDNSELFELTTNQIG
ncbi:DUF2971 domain-containing protein [Sporosarcina sp. FSL W7-1349]|uniref:DUF2971 domain-containing protein n=1 Tax=Sporosarcina sp. FSL W7-1349 TaxID=2921561 RepID=UPI0030F7E7B1